MKKTRLATRYVFYMGLILLLANIALGIVLMVQSTNSLSGVVKKNMLDISNSAAKLIDGDAFASVTEETVGGETYKDIYDQLSIFQHNVDIKYIYSVRKLDEDHFIFVVDADPDTPAAYGEYVVVSEALRTAANGTADIDNATVSDRWGTFYTAYSPIRNSAGNVVGVVGVDIDAEWYESRIQTHAITILIISLLFTLAGIAVVLLITLRDKKRLTQLETEISNLTYDIDALTKELQSNPDYRKIRIHIESEIEVANVDSGTDEISALSDKVRSLHIEMNRYLEYAGTQINTDALTGVRSTAAYLDKCSNIDVLIREGTASYTTILFDINRLKQINDQHGHDAGDQVIRGAANAVSHVFGTDRTYRIGGDEFTVILDDIKDPSAEMQAVQDFIAKINAQSDYTDKGLVLSLSGGYAQFDPDNDRYFRETFARADMAMYLNKNANRSTEG